MVVITLGQEGPTVGINFDWENVGGLNQWLLTVKPGQAFPSLTN